MQDYAQANGFNPEKGFQNSMWQLNDQYEISPSSSNSNLREEGELCDDFSQYGCMSPYSVYGSYLGYYGDDMLYEGYDQTYSLRNPEPFWENKNVGQQKNASFCSFSSFFPFCFLNCRSSDMGWNSTM